MGTQEILLVLIGIALIIFFIFKAGQWFGISKKDKK